MNSLVNRDLGGIEDPVNFGIMDVENFLYQGNCLPVTTSLIMEPSTNNFHDDGLYSEKIFGPVGSRERMLKFGYIDLNTTIISPNLFGSIVKLGSLYKDIMSGATFATFDPVLKDFKRVNGSPIDTPGAGTGFSFFLRHFNEISFRRSEKYRRDNRIDVIETYKDRALMTRYLVEPAGLRDIVNDSSGRLVQDDINKLYTSLLLYTRSIPKGSQSPLYDSVRYQIQSKAQEIYDYIENFLDGKHGFIQGSFARRKVAMGTRNVITAATLMAASPDDPQLHSVDDVVVGVYQTIKGLTPFTKNTLANIFITPIFKYETTTKIALSDPKTLELVYVNINPSERDKFTSDEGIEKLINNFRNTDLRSKPVMVKDSDGKDYALLLVYDDNDTITLCRSLRDLETRWSRKVDKKKLRPLTYIEMFYIVAEVISQGKHGMVTRYPVIEQGSTYVASIHVVSTTPSRKVEFVDLLDPMMSTMTLKQYPNVGASYMDAMMVHPSKLAGLGGD